MLKCTKFDFGSGSAPDPARGAHSASLYRPPNCIQGVLLLREGEGKRKRGKGRERKKDGKRRGGERRRARGYFAPSLAEA